MPTAIDEERAQHQFTRMQVLLESFEEVLEDWLEEQIGAERSQVWGIPDTSANPLADLSRQLSTPGLYGIRPQVRHATAEVEELIGPDGHLDRAGWYAKMQFVQYLTLGMGDMILGFHVNARRQLTVRMVWPHNCVKIAAPDDPGQAAQFWELRTRVLDEKEIFVWEVYDLGELGPLDPATNKPSVVREPSFRIFEANPGSGRAPSRRVLSDALFAAGGLGRDLSHRFVLQADGTAGALVGEQYPWRSEGGDPVFPFAFYQAMDSGQLWNVHDKRGTLRGTLNTALFWTFAAHCAKDATGSYVIVAGLEPGAGTVHMGDNVGIDQNPIGGNVPVVTKIVTPGCIEYHDIVQGATPFVHEVGPGVNLPNVLEFADRYELKQAVRWGLNPSDLSRQSANPSSAAALMVSNEGKREFSDQVAPHFRPVDLTSIAIAAMVLRVGGVVTFAESGYSIQYHRIPRSASERSDQRDQFTWEQEQGLRSKIQTYMVLHDGTTRADALAGLVRVALDELELAQAVNEAGLAAGLVTETDTPTNRIQLTGTDLAAVVSVNEVRLQDGLPALTDADGNPDPDGALTVAEFRAKREGAAKPAPVPFPPRSNDVDVDVDADTDTDTDDDAEAEE